MKVWKKSLAVMLTGLTVLAGVPFTAAAAEHAATAAEVEAVRSGASAAYQWENDGLHWKLLYLNQKAMQWQYAAKQWVQIGGKFYHFNADGEMEEGWFEDDGMWYFAQYDSKTRDSANAGVVLTGWASIPDPHGTYHTFYFGAAENGRPNGLYCGEGEYYKSYTVDGSSYSFDGNGYCANAPYGSIPRYDNGRI